MMSWSAPGLGILVGILVVLHVRPALAEDSSCPRMDIRGDASLETRWPGLLEDVRAAFDTRGDVDRCARVELRLRTGSVALEIVLPDGRSTTRSVSRREDVVPTLEALLLVPQRIEPLPPLASESSQPSPPATNPASPPAKVAALGATGVDPAVAVRDVSVPSPAHASRHLRIELSVATGVRVGDGQMSVGLGALSFLDLSGWLVGFEGRVDRYRMLGPSPTDGGALELAVLAGRRFRFRNVAVDLVAGPAAALQGTASFTSQSASGNTLSESSSSTVPRLLIDTRVTFGALSTLRTFIGVDAGFGPPRAGAIDVPGAPRLPIWTLGLALGATVGTQ
ncbi:MAG TPA: hypothetical protein VIJ22_14140 [Polyangiaceae bacterium]